MGILVLFRIDSATLNPEPSNLNPSFKGMPRCDYESLYGGRAAGFSPPTKTKGKLSAKTVSWDIGHLKRAKKQFWRNPPEGTVI